MAAVRDGCAPVTEETSNGYVQDAKSTEWGMCAWFSQSSVCVPVLVPAPVPAKCLTVLCRIQCITLCGMWASWLASSVWVSCKYWPRKSTADVRKRSAHHGSTGCFGATNRTAVQCSIAARSRSCVQATTSAATSHACQSHTAVQGSGCCRLQNSNQLPKASDLMRKDDVPSTVHDMC